ncbi:MAG: response regulator [Vicinamibacterales bacterium]
MNGTWDAVAQRTRPDGGGADAGEDAATPAARGDHAPSPVPHRCPEAPAGQPPQMLVPLDAVGEALVVVDRDHLILDANAAFARLVGAPMAVLAGAPLARWVFVPPAPAEGPLAPPCPRPRRAATFEAADGQCRQAVVHVAPLGSERSLITVRDGSDDARLDAALQQVRDLTEQLRRSQKIGALGRLAGGVAHDFNNLLQVIGGQAEALAVPELDGPSRLRLVASIRAAADRAASLTRQLLAFGRRQLMAPEVLDLNETVRTLERMLTRVIGDDVRLLATLAPELAPVRVDPGQIEQVVLNLAINARDAMLEGGALEIATANFRLDAPWAHPSLPVRVPPGRWVLLSVRDTGCGMDQDTAAQAFEPFFTTKDASEGSGLGLSMVYGIVKQSHGYTWIDTAPGAGTAVHVLLPAVAGQAAPQTDRRSAAPASVSRPAGASILLVEDDAEVRGLFTRFLESAGYRVHEAADGGLALDAFERHGGAFDLVISDVLMPNISGLALTRAIRLRRPDVKVLLVSGYADELEAGTTQAPHTELVHKPITRQVLLDRVEALLTGTAA